MDKEQELRHCPFCGGPAKTVWYHSLAVVVRCTKCESEGPDVSADEAEAIAAWNRRSSSDEQRAEVVGWTGRRGDYPPGTKAFSIDGGHWTRVEGGWKWHMGDVFPSLGADAFKIEILASPVATGGVTEEQVEAAMVAGWNACRRSIYAVCEDVIGKADGAQAPTVLRGVLTSSQEAHAKGFHGGEKHAAKSIARGFNSMEASDDNHFREALTASLAVRGEGMREVRCVDCNRHVMAEPMPATGWITACGKRLTRIGECGTEPRCTRDISGETVLPTPILKGEGV